MTYGSRTTLGSDAYFDRQLLKFVIATSHKVYNLTDDKKIH